MRAAVLERQGEALQVTTVPDPEPGPDQLLLTVHACAVCRTDLHLRDHEIEATKLPVVLGHQIVGTTEDGRRVGVPWLGWTDGTCKYCTSGRENLCISAKFTGRDIDGGYAQQTVADERFCLPLPDGFEDLDAAPLLCGGLIGYRTLRAAGDPARLGIYGFGAAAHQVCQVAIHERREVYAVTRPGDDGAQGLARELGAAWAGGSDERPPVELDAALIFAPVGDLVPLALRAVRAGGAVVCGGIHMSDIPSFPYELLWGERTLRSVANLTRSDGTEFLELAAAIPVRTRTTVYELADAQCALDDMRDGNLVGAAVLVP